MLCELNFALQKVRTKCPLGAYDFARGIIKGKQLF